MVCSVFRWIVPALFLSLSLTTLLQAQDANTVAKPILPATAPLPSTDETFDWNPALTQSMRFLLMEHGFRLAFQPGTRRRLGGPFFRDYVDSVKATHGWGDSDNIFLNYVAHPMQGAMVGYIQVQNDPNARKLEFGRSREYWNSRLKALAWSTAYSTQFELGPISEASIGNVGQRKGTSGYVDLIITPTGGFAVMLAEDALDRFIVRKWEARTRSVPMRTFYRIAFNPCRAFANVLRGKGPWHRDNRPLSGF